MLVRLQLLRPCGGRVSFGAAARGRGVRQTSARCSHDDRRSHAPGKPNRLRPPLRLCHRFMMMLALFMRMKKPSSSSEKPGSSSSHSNEPPGPAPAVQ